ncbi:putative alternative oxidase AlxA [Fimicolochytrium jonesii]|uniref:putative alternative oxidase AlxA n=1 Tax=Fimicolochytrium jonesii TaxID=1396493 RepID=UPI0022FE9967|nr:putative alternative oxidase AlxA [Fimicolochytrium jonesii]KAI8825228.1 putative alternative oxidase AlxA [Fimicolochytrium jonesii]
MSHHLLSSRLGLFCTHHTPSPALLSLSVALPRRYLTSSPRVRTGNFADHPRVTDPIPSSDASTTTLPLTTRSGPHPKVNVDPNTTAWRKEEPATETKKSYVLARPIYSPSELNVAVTHRDIQSLSDRVSYALVRVMRFGFDTATRYSDQVGAMTEHQWLNRLVFLETVAGVPGFVGGILRHLRSLRLLKRDNGWIHTLLDEAQNERMHLLSFLKVKQPNLPFRMMVLLAQGTFFNLFFLSYILSPRMCHRFVGYLEESAVHTYTHCLKDIESGQLRHWATTPAPEIAREYWQLGDGATLRDMVLAVRADEAEHRDVNHTLASLKPDDKNPF